MSRKLTLDINFIDTPRDGDVFGYQISNNGVPLSFNGFDGWDKVFKESTDYTNANGYITMLNSDLTPNTSDNASIGNGFDGVVNVVKRQSTGKYICVGGFTSYQGITLPSRKICRLNADFSLDTSFTPPDFPVDLPTLEIDSNDKIYLGSSNTTSGKGRLVRLNANGTLDGGYMPGIGFDRPVMAIKLQPDGKLLVAGVFTTFNSSPAKGIIRLGITGVKDVSFNGVNQGFVLNNSFPRSIDLQSNGDIVIGGDFYMYNNTACGNIIILTSTGAVSKVPTDLDNSPGGILSENVLKVLVDPSDRIYVTGKFERYGGGVACNKIIRLYKNTFNNWVPDLTFNVISQGLDNGNSIYTTGGFDMLFNDNGNLVVVGNFGTVQGTTAQNIAVLDETGILSPDGEDTSGQFTSTGFPPTLKTILNLGDRFILGGSFNSYSNVGIPAVSSQFVIPIAEELTPDFGSGFDDTVTTISVRNNKIIVGGIFTQFSGNVAGKVIRLNADGSYDATFDTTVGVQSGFGALIASAITSDDKVYLTGEILTYDGNSCKGLVRLNDDGSYDSTFVTGTGLTGPSSAGIGAAYTIIPDEVTDGVLLIGSFTGYNGVSTGGIIKLTATGSIDTTFNVGTGFGLGGYSPNGVVQTQDGGYIITGGFLTFNGATANRIIKLTATGSVDTTFNVGSGANNTISGIKLQSDGKVVCMMASGLPMPPYNRYNGVAFSGSLFRINTNGSFDASFNSSQYITNGVLPNLIEVDGEDRIYVYDDIINTSVVRYTKDGIYDPTFSFPSLGGSTGFPVQTIKNYFNSILVGGTFVVNSVNISMLDFDGNIATTNVDNYQTIINTYDNLIDYNSGYGIQYSLLSDKVRMEYTFSNNAIVINDVYETTDYVEITYTNESLTLEELVQEIAVRSPYLIVSNSASFSSVNYKIRVYEGSIFTGPSQSINYDITKDKLFTGQSNIYVNINNLVREKLEANVTTFNDSSYFSSQLLPDNMSKWVLVDETIFDGAATQSTAVYYLHALDGYLYNTEQQGSPNVFINGDKRYIHRNQPQRIYFQANFLIGITITDQFGGLYIPQWDATNILADNKKYIQSFEVDPYYRIPGGSRPITLTSYVDYNFTYDAGAGRVYTITKRFEIYDDCKYDLYTIVYKNKFGVLESIAFSRKAVKSLDVKAVDYERSILDYNGSYDITRHTNKQYNLNGYESWVLNTNWMPEYMNEAFEELSLSEEVWIITEDGSIIPIVKEDTRIDFKTQLNDKLIQYTMKVKMSHQVIKNIL